MLALNTQAILAITEAYHIYAYGECVTENGGELSKCASSDSGEIIPNLCLVSGASTWCSEPEIIYQNQFLPFVQAQFRAGGAPYSTDYYLMANGNRQLLVRSIETYNAAAGADCPDPIKNKLCGPTVGAPGHELLPRVAVGPEPNRRYCKGKNGRWEPASWLVFSRLLFQGYNQSGNSSVYGGDFLCTMSLSGGNRNTCTQANGGLGLQHVASKTFWHPETRRPYGFDLQCFLDGNLRNSFADQPVCDDARFKSVLKQTVRTLPGSTGVSVTYSSRSGLVSAPVYSNFYVADGQASSKNSSPSWSKRPTYLLPNPNGAYHWPSLPLSSVTCSDGTSAEQKLNPAGVPSLCGRDLDAWFDAQVPSGPVQLTSIADTTIDPSDRNDNDGANPRLMLVANNRAVFEFDPGMVAEFMAQNELGRAQLVLSSADRSEVGGDSWLQASPLDGTFVEGNGVRPEGKRGTGPGATYNCAADAEIADFAEDCLEAWPEDFNRATGPMARVPQGVMGEVSFDVTNDVAEGMSTWQVRRLRGGYSEVMHSREGAEQLGDPSLAPTPILYPADEDEVAAAGE